MERERKAGQMDMLQGTLLDKILIFAIPVAASSILQQLFNSADVAVVGRFAGSRALAAVGGNSSVISLLINLFVGISVGANVVIANLIGQRNTERVQDVVHTVVTMALLSGVFLLAVGVLIARPVLTLMNTPGDVMGLAVLYLRIYFLGMPFQMIYNFGSAILRSIGDTRRPLYCLLFSGVVNVGLNLLLVVVFRLSVAGVAIATVVANGVSAGLVFYFLLREEGMLRVQLRKLCLHRGYAFQILRIGVPAGIQGMVFSLSNVCIQTAINSFGADGIAGSAAAVNFEFFTYFVTSAFGQAAVTFTSQNYGAGQFGRCRKIFRICMACGLLATGLMSGTFVAFRGFFVRFYTVDPAVLDYALARMARVEILACMPVTYEVGGAALRGMGHSLLPAILTMVGSCGFRFVWVYTVFARFRSFEMLLAVYPATWFLTGAAVLAAYFWVCKKEMRA